MVHFELSSYCTSPSDGLASDLLYGKPKDCSTLMRGGKARLVRNLRRAKGDIFEPRIELGTFSVLD